MIIAKLHNMAVERRGVREWILTAPAGERRYKTKRAALAALARNESGGAIEFIDGPAGGNLVKRAKAHGYGPAALAEAMGVSRRTLEAWQRGQNKIPAPARKLLEHLIERGKTWNSPSK